VHHWEENLCNKPGSLGIYNDGGCAAYGSIKNAKLSPNDNVVIVGAGGLALMTIRQAKAVTRAKIIAVHLDDNKLKVAKENGANSVVNSRKEDPIKTVMELTDKTSPDAVIDFINSSKIVETE
jgi:alcohol dehydrogenase, propanol-preferring